MRVQATGVGQHPDARTAERVRLRADGRPGVAERSAVGGHPGDREDAGAVLGHQGQQALAADAEFGGVEFGGLRCGAGHQVGDAQIVAGQQVLLARGEAARG